MTDTVKVAFRATGRLQALLALLPAVSLRLSEEGSTQQRGVPSSGG